MWSSLSFVERLSAPFKRSNDMDYSWVGLRVNELLPLDGLIDHSIAQIIGAIHKWALDAVNKLNP